MICRVAEQVARGRNAEAALNVALVAAHEERDAALRGQQDAKQAEKAREEHLAAAQHELLAVQAHAEAAALQAEEGCERERAAASAAAVGLQAQLDNVRAECASVLTGKDDAEIRVAETEAGAEPAAAAV